MEPPLQHGVLIDMPSLYYGNILISSGAAEHETLKISIAKASDFPSTVTLPENTVELGNNCFKGCIALTDVTLPDSLTTIGNSCFEGCSSLSSITIPDTVTNIGSSCFNNCSSLNSVSFKGDPPVLGNNAFSGLTFTAYYDYSNTNWTASVKSENYGGAAAVTWLSIQPGLLLNVDVLSSSSSANGIKDISGNANHGSLSGSVSIDKGHTYFDFDGADNSKIEVSNSSFTDELNGKTALTLSITAKCTDTSYPRFGGLQQSSGGYFFGFLYFSSATTVCFGDRMSSSSEAIKSLSATTTPLDWHNYTVTVDYSSGVAILYIDGVEKARSTDWFQGTKANVDILRLGQSSSSSNSYYKFKGYIRNVLVYDKALTAEEVVNMYNSTLIPEVDSSTAYIAYELHQINETGKRYPIEYAGNLSNCIPIKYYDGVTNMGSWESWINSHFTPVMLKSNGTVDYELNRDNLNYKADGTTASDISNTSYDGNAMLRIKKFYISCSSETVGSGSSAYTVHTIKMCDSKLDNTYTCWGFVDANGVEQPFAYYALFNCHKDSNGKLRSLAGITLNNSMPGNQLLKYDDMITAATANGTGWNISNLALENAIGLVLMMIYKCVNPLFINQDSTDNYMRSVDVSKITGSRAADGGFPYVSSAQQQKALWLENYWRYYDTIGQSMPWINGLASLKIGTGINDVRAYYCLKGPYTDFTTISNWTPMLQTSAHSYASDNVSHELHTVTFYENIMFAENNGVSRAGSVSSTSLNRYFGGGMVTGNGPSSQYTDKLMPCRTGAQDMVNQYASPPHFLGYSMDGTGVNNYQKYGAGRLTYLPQS